MNILWPNDCIFSPGLVWILMLQSVWEMLLCINTKFQLYVINNGWDLNIKRLTGLGWFGLGWIGLVWFGLDFDVAIRWGGLTKHTYQIWVQSDKKCQRTKHLKVNWFGLVWFGLVWFGFLWFGLEFDVAVH